MSLIIFNPFKYTAYAATLIIHDNAKKLFLALLAFDLWSNMWN